MDAPETRWPDKIAQCAPAVRQHIVFRAPLAACALIAVVAELVALRALAAAAAVSSQVSPCWQP
jgi:hypothetical protein